MILKVNVNYNDMFLLLSMFCISLLNIPIPFKSILQYLFDKCIKIKKKLLFNQQ